jgi:4-aminobutyrate aminotransferase-like enzyme
VPELICLGKALTGGFPLSACVGRAEVMDGAWPPSTGEAIHTSTFLGHPVGCAMALAQIREIEQRQLVKRCATTGASLAQALAALPRKQGRLRLAARSIGLMAGIELRDRDGRPAGDAVLGLTKAMLRRGFLALPEGDQGEVLGLTPPLTITLRQIEAAVGALAGALHEEAR